MAQFPNTNSILLREPTLFTPGRKPIGKVKIEWGHPLTEGLQSFTLLAGIAGRGRDLVANLPLDFNAQVATSILEHNQALEISRSGQDDCAFFQPRKNFYQSIVKQMTIVSRCKFNAVSVNGAIVSVPYRSTGWSVPFMSMAFGRLTSFTDARLFIAQSGAWNAATSGAGYLDLNLHTYAAVLNTEVTPRVNFYKDGVYFSNDTSDITDTPIDWNTENPLTFGNASNNGASSESNEIEEEYAMIFNRVLEVWELKELYDDPYQFLSVA